jgi:hypothetical protein
MINLQGCKYFKKYDFLILEILGSRAYYKIYAVFFIKMLGFEIIPDHIYSQTHLFYIALSNKNSYRISNSPFSDLVHNGIIYNYTDCRNGTVESVLNNYQKEPNYLPKKLIFD